MYQAIEYMRIGINLLFYLRRGEGWQLALLLQDYIVPATLCDLAQCRRIAAMLLQGIATGCTAVIVQRISAGSCKLCYSMGQIIHVSIAIAYKKYTDMLLGRGSKAI